MVRMLTPDDLRYSSDHEWVRLEDGNRARLGITDYAQDALGDVVFIELPEVGSVVKASDSISEVESTKSVSDVYSPVDGEVVEGRGGRQALIEDPSGNLVELFQAYEG